MYTNDAMLEAAKRDVENLKKSVPILMAMAENAEEEAHMAVLGFHSGWADGVDLQAVAQSAAACQRAMDQVCSYIGYLVAVKKDDAFRLVDLAADYRELSSRYGGIVREVQLMVRHKMSSVAS